MEKQNIEWKESWRDEYLKWICGFANAEGGKLYIGKDNSDNVTGISNANKLLENLPNKIRSVLGILAEVNHYDENGKDYLEIVVDAYPYPVSYKEKYFIRSGSTLQELKGNDLNKFILERKGLKWDGVPVPGTKVNDLSKTAIKRYKEKAVRSKRINAEVLEDGEEILLDNLRMLDQELLKRAAILLFHPDPEKYVSGAFIKIGFFRSDDDLAFQDEVHGNIMVQIDKTDDLLKTKYATYMIEYSGISRIEKSPFPEAANREALLNAIAHKDYSEPYPIQISVYPDQILFWNPGKLTEKLTIEQLSQKHASIPNNPDIANGLFRSGDIEAWGKGTIKMIKACVEHELLPPAFHSDASGFSVQLFNNTEKALQKRGLESSLIKVIKDALANKQTTNARVQDICSVTKATATRYLKKLEGMYLDRVGETGRGTYYKIKGS